MYPSVKLPPPLPIRHLYILLALSRGPAHGYAIGAIVENDSLGSLRMRDGTLYRSLKDLLLAGLIEDAGHAPAGPSGDNRRHYVISGRGQSALRQELKRYQHASEIGSAAGLFDDDIPEDIRQMIEALK